jgi:SNF2 family DNA or RNA helicase
MGLGKTLSSIAIIAGHPSEDRKVKTTLVVAPLALLEQYVNTFVQYTDNQMEGRDRVQDD